MRSASAGLLLFLVSYNTLANNRGGKTHRLLRASYRIDTRLTRVAIRPFSQHSAIPCVSTASHGRGILYTAQTKLPSILEDARR